MMKFLLVGTILLMTACAGKNTVIKFNIAEAMGIRVNEGKAEELPRATLVGVEAVVPLVNCWAWHGEAGFAAGHAAFLPSPRLFTGPSVCMGDRWRFGGGLVWQANPGYHGSPTHVLGAGAGPSVMVNDTLGLAFPVGVGRTLQDGHWGAWAVTTQIRLMFFLAK